MNLNTLNTQIRYVQRACYGSFNYLYNKKYYENIEK